MTEYIVFLNQFNNVVENSNAIQAVNKPDGLIIFIIAGILILSLIFLIFFYLIPKFRAHTILNLKLVRIRNKSEYKLSIRNKTNDFIEIKAPEIILKGLHPTKKMKAKSGNYPLTISPGDSHSIIFRKEQLLSKDSKKAYLKLFRIIVYDRYNNVFKTKLRFL